MAGKYQPYPAYKPSGVEWLGEIPNGWSHAPLKYMALDEKSLFLDGDWIESKDLSDDGIRYITTGNVGEGAYKEQGGGYISERTFRKINASEVFKGDILVSRLNPPIGRACIVPDLSNRIVTSVDNVIFRPDAKFHRGFVVYMLSSREYFGHTSNMARGATMQRISRGLLGNIRIVFPPLPEQTQIAAFLDHETAKIDALIAKQERLIALLEEKRQAVISHAVTKGLNPDAPLRPSGIEWLGDVPAHWTHAPLKYMALEENSLFLDGDWIESKDLSDEGIRYITTGNVGAGAYKEQGQGYISQSTFKKIDATEVIEGDILVSRLNAPIGRACIVPELASRIVTSVDNVIFRPDAKFHRPYVVYMLSSQEYFAHTSNMARGATMQRISRGLLGNVRIAFPAHSEQIEIANFLEREIEKFDALATNAQTAATLLKERRTALISAAVTGKIDVRDWQPPKDISDQNTTQKAFA